MSRDKHVKAFFLIIKISICNSACSFKAMAPIVFTNIHIRVNTHYLQVCVQEEQQCVARGVSDCHQQGSGYNACCVWSHTEAAGLIYT
jgi:hypothetical protein